MIRVKENYVVYKADWGKVEALPVVVKGQGYDLHQDSQGRVFKVTFPTWLEGKKVHLQ